MDSVPVHKKQAPAQDELADIDVDLLDYLQSLTPAERLRGHEQALALARELRAAGIRHYGFDPHDSETTR